MSSKKTKKQKLMQKSTKLKSILSQPPQDYSPILDDGQMQQLFDIFKEGIEKSAEAPTTYAKKHNIKIGLESVMRAINNKECIYLLMSNKIRPPYILMLLSKHVKNQDPKMLDYIHADVSKLTEEVFGIPAMAMAICQQAGTNAELDNWISRNKYERKPANNQGASGSHREYQPLVVKKLKLNPKRGPS